MAISLKLRALEPDVDGSEQFSLETSELAELLAIKEQDKGSPLDSPEEAFGLLTALGYKRGDTLDDEERVREFTIHLQRMYWGSGNITPELDELVDLMAYLGYTRPLV